MSAKLVLMRLANQFFSFYSAAQHCADQMPCDPDKGLHLLGLAFS